MTSRWISGTVCVALATLVCAAYWPVHSFDFVNFDDPTYVSENLHVQMGLSWENVLWAFRSTFFDNWHPLTWLSYLLDYTLFGLNPGAFHLVNLFVHALNSLLVFMLFKRMTGNLWPSAFLAGLFALHPLHVESVAWISERKDVLSGFFGLLALWSYLRYVERPKVGRYLLVFGFFALSLMAKPMLVTLPFVFLLLDFWPLRRITEQPDGSVRRSSEAAAVGKPSALRVFASPAVRRLLTEKIPFFALTAASSVITYLAQHGAIVPASALPFGKRLANALVSYWCYIAKTVWPARLAVFYPHPGQWLSWQVLLAFLLLAGITILVLRAWRKRPYLAVGWLWYVGTLVPVVGLVQVGRQSFADRYMYVPIIGLGIILGWGVKEMAERWRIRGTGLLLAATAVMAAWLMLTSAQTRVWQDRLTLWEHALAVTGSGIAHQNLGGALLELGKTNEAVAHFSAALEIDPDDCEEVYGEFGNILLRQGKTEEAMAKYLKGLEFNPKNPELNNNFGLCLAGQGKFSEAARYYSAAIESKPEFMDAYLNLGNAQFAEGKLEEALQKYDAVLRLMPNSVMAHYNKANALLKLGRSSEAEVHYLTVLRLQPANAAAHSNLALVLASQGKNREALAHLTEAVRLKPDEVEFHFRLATLLDAEQRAKEAVEQYREALRLKPDLVGGLNNLAWILATSADDTVRGGAEAVRCAERACELTGHQQAFLLGTLAAAYAEAGQYSNAVTTAQKASELASAAGQNEVAATNQKLLEFYRAGKPYRAAK